MGYRFPSRSHADDPYEPGRPAVRCTSGSYPYITDMYDDDAREWVPVDELPRDGEL